MLIVVIFHTLLWQVLLVDGHIQVIPWAPGPVWWAISWICTIIPVFFVAAGYANAAVVDSWRRTGSGYSSFITVRVSRMIGPMTVFILVFAALGTVGAWIGWPAQAAAYSRQFAQLLWFAVVYLLLLGAAPLAVWLHDRFAGWVMLPLLVALIGVDVAVRVSGDQSLQWLNLAFVWPLAHQWGIAYHRGWFRNWPTRWVVGLFASGAVVIAALVGWLHYPQAAVAWADIPVANLLPPTLAITVLGLCQTAVLALLEKAHVAERLSEAWQRRIRLTNALLLSAYLWQVPVIVVVAAALAGLSLLFPAASGVLLHPLLLVVGVLAVLSVTVPQVARLEMRLIPTPGIGDPDPWRAVGGFALFATGTWAVWQWGALLHPSEPTAGLALIWFLAGSWFLRHATMRTSG
jgi:hypothetical protein